MSEQEIVWIGGYGSPAEGKEYVCVRRTAEAAMQAMAEHWDRTSPPFRSIVERLEFVQNDMEGIDREYVGYAPAPHPRWEADISYVDPTGQFVSQFVYIEPFVLPEAGSES